MSASLLRMRVRLAPGVARPSGRSSRILPLATEKGRNNTVSQRQQTASGRRTTSTRGRGTEEVDKRQTLSGKRTGKGRTEEVSYVKPRTVSSRPAKAAQEEEEAEPGPNRTAALVADVKAKVEYVASRPQLLTYAGAAAGGLLVTSILISAVNDIPLLPKVLELAGLLYVAGFIYNYLLFQAGRQKLAKNLLEIKDKVTEVASSKTDS